MKWINDLKGKVKETAEVAYEKSSQVVEVTKIKLKISEAESEVDKLYIKLGEMIYKDYKDGSSVSDGAKELCELVSNKKLEIETLKNQVDDLKDVKECAKCGTKNPADSKFCSNCGEKIEN